MENTDYNKSFVKQQEDKLTKEIEKTPLWMPEEEYKKAIDTLNNIERNSLRKYFEAKIKDETDKKN